MVKVFIILLFVCPLPSYGLTNELKSLESTIENLGTKVKWSNGHELCKKANNIRLYGLYFRNKDIIVMCQGNHKKNYKELIRTLKHEGWHAVQKKCNSNSTVLNRTQIKVGLKQQEVLNLKSLYLGKVTPQDYELEKEAFVVEKIPSEAWIRGTKFYCKTKN